MQRVAEGNIYYCQSRVTWEVRKNVGSLGEQRQLCALLVSSVDDARAPGASKLATLVNHSSCTAGVGKQKVQGKQGATDGSRIFDSCLLLCIVLYCYNVDTFAHIVHPHLSHFTFFIWLFFNITIYNQSLTMKFNSIIFLKTYLKT